MDYQELRRYVVNQLENIDVSCYEGTFDDIVEFAVEALETEIDSIDIFELIAELEKVD